MAANLFGERFYSLREPAWHALGHVSEVEETATEAWGKMTPFIITLEDLSSKSLSIDVPYRAIVRHPVPDDNEYRVLGVVGREYHLLDPQTFCEDWDEAVKRPIETLGSLGKGDTLFVSTKLQKFSVLGDEVENYLLAVSPYIGNASIEMMVTGVRVVCQNTLRLARSRASSTFHLIHDDVVDFRFRLWLSSIIKSMERKSTDLAEEFTRLAQTPIKSIHSKVSDGALAEVLIEEIYPDTPTPQPTPDPAEEAKRQQAWDEFQKLVVRSREAVFALYQGEATGSDTPAFKGTAWGLYNSVVEWEDYKRSTKWESARRDALFGTRAQTKSRAFEVLSTFATQSAS